ncbi:NAD(P)/FAD-dependent oxidoreductase [Aminobacter anthyllidis]|uniref:Thioredoxin reductase n=1 Tax=Aminobacter anthyllidis TaxID=1035067 RepID=A0A9X1AAY3_9HYPH|nr:NAD(P)/FAD-dependent oxidoreductase [Aminobacter anthyllidis]MBT1156440.1 NAD(P)/FAD-dependent oxidoreductase [Aminobacter anthyllidis]
MNFDVVIVGGSYAGISAGLQLARARRKVLVVDAGERRNRFAAQSHGFLGQDGREPGAIAADARTQLERYPDVTWIEGRAEGARRQEGGFAIGLGSGHVEIGRRLILAAGVSDSLPDIPGLRERWGRSVFHCPYCHGYELDQGRIGVLAVSEHSMHHGLMLPDWGTTTLFTNGAFVPDADQLRQLATRGTAVETALVREVRGEGADVVLDDGRVVALDGLFTMPRTSLQIPWVEQLGCELETGPMGPFIRTDAMKQTTVRGVFACGDIARAAGSVALSVGDGAMAGAATHRSLMFEAD